MMYFCPLYLLVPVATDGDVYGRLPAVPAEHLRCDLVPAVDVGGGKFWGAAGPLHCLHLLLLCEYLMYFSHTILSILM